MPKITASPHPESMSEGVEPNVPVGTSIREALLDNGIEIEHVYDMSCACMTCHCIVRKGFDSPNKVEECEDDLFNRARGLEAQLHLSCQTIVVDEGLTVEIPKYTINYVKEDH